MFQNLKKYAETAQFILLSGLITACESLLNSQMLKYRLTKLLRKWKLLPSKASQRSYIDPGSSVFTAQD